MSLPTPTIDPKALMLGRPPVFVALDDRELDGVFLVGVFASEDDAKGACEQRYRAEFICSAGCSDCRDAVLMWETLAPNKRGGRLSEKDFGAPGVFLRHDDGALMVLASGVQARG